MKGNYVIKNQKLFKEKIKNTDIKTQKNLADIVGIGEDYMSQIINGKPTTKPTALAITKMLDSDAEIENFFELVLKNYCNFKINNI